MSGPPRAGEAFTHRALGHEAWRPDACRGCPDPAPRPNSVKRIRDKYEAELSELEQSERKLQERCSELKGRLAEAEGESVRLQGLLRQRDQELTDLRAVSGGERAVG